MEPLRAGTSGWQYGHWIGRFYSPGTRRKDLLRAYAEHFSTTEINASFYRLPTEKAVAAWREQTPDGFLFAWKASRYVTHVKRLRDVAESVALVLGRMAGLGPKSGPVLWQLPPGLHRDDRRLADFLRLLPTQHRHAVEFRHPSWYEAAVLGLLADRDVALCISDHAAAPAPWEATARFVYLRGHGPGGRYRGRYDDAVLADWAGRIDRFRAAGRAVFAYFDNDVDGCAPADAKRLIALTSP